MAAVNKNYYYQDMQNSTVLVISGEGSTIKRYAYDAFGGNIGDDAANTNEYLYAGKPLDRITSLLNYGFRDYKPGVGRFTRIDPLRDGDNWYNYCGNDPVNFVDLWGLCKEGNGKLVDFGLPEIWQLNIIPSIPRFEYEGNGWDWLKAVGNGYTNIPNGVIHITNV